MEPHKNQELNDQELNELLSEWRAPAAPIHLRSKIFRAQRHRHWWQRVWATSVRIPLPVAFAMMILLISASIWQWRKPPQVRILVKTERVEVPVITEHIVTHTVYKKQLVELLPRAPQFRPVTELRPRIVRSQSIEN